MGISHDRPPKRFNPAVPNEARMYDYAMGGKDNYRADRDAAEQIGAALPSALAGVRENRQFMRRAVRHLLSVGVRQFLDLGCGMPGRGNVHDLVAAAEPSATVVYVDNEPMVVNHFQALLSSSSVATALLADIRRPGDILSSPEVGKLIDFRRPVGIVLTAVLHYFEDEDDPAGLVKEFVSGAAPGSHVVLTHYHPEGIPPEDRAVTAEFAASLNVTMAQRSRAEIEALFGDLVLVEPGLVPPPRWRPDRPLRDSTGWLLAGVARKP
ncbi:SAM-dependent methyltransferase [Actinoallomurus sp. CA-142502]|uniref:SAM-dependent methyltransferase n=1 Tax=Actinoallomurus sp. CA-142502 TaxID=3239885 RepID=UPI003D8EE6D9